jgi:thiamine-monophosphate kinase
VTVSDFSERELIARIQQRLPPPPAWLLVGIGDDAAVVEPERNRVEVLSVDALVEGVHFERAFVPPHAIGHRALAVNLSDLAAMGAQPRLALVSLALPASLQIADFDGIADGFVALALGHRLHVVGGNLTRTPGPLTLDITVMGTVKRRQALTRRGARPGDDLYLTGTIGAAAAGLQLLREATGRQSSVASLELSVVGPSHQSDDPSMDVSRLAPNVLGLATDDWRLATAYLFPNPRVRVGTLLARNRAATACMDLSDGLADAVQQVAEASGVGATVDVGALPIDPAARAWFASNGLDPIAEAVTGGDDYELLVAVRPRLRRRLKAVTGHSGAPLTRIGVCTERRDLLMTGPGGDTAPLPQGYRHFR